MTTLQPGLYSVMVKGQSNTTGVAIVEVFDQDKSGAPAKLVNISSRGLVKTGDSIMIAGFVITGTQPLTVVIRGSGPALLSAGVTGVLADPALELYDVHGAKILENDDWDAAGASDFAAVGAVAWPVASKDAAIVATLPPGAYTTMVRGKNGGTGVALVEVFSE